MAITDAFRNELIARANNSFFFFDTETTGKGDEAKIIQFAGKSSDGLERFNLLFNPHCEIEVGAMAVHHITPDKVAECKGFYSFIETLNRLSKNNVMVAHNAPFDVGRIVFEGADKPEFVIDTLKLAKHTFPRLESYSLSYLRYYFRIYDLGDAERAHDVAHDALGDVLVLERVFERIRARFLQEFQIPEIEAIPAMIEYSERPVTLALCPFGRHKGKEMKDVPKDWLKWALTNISDLDPDTHHTFLYFA